MKTQGIRIIFHAYHLINAGDQFILGRPFTYDLHMLDDIQLYVADDRLTAATVDQKSGEARRVRGYIQSHRVPAHALPVFLLRLDQVILGDQAPDDLGNSRLRQSRAPGQIDS
jgi:hypothetical protein